MRKRLIERLTHSKQGSLGYTLTEMLVVIAIIAIACAIAIPSIFYLRDMLRFAQANNYAKSIFLAAQQNLTELRSDGGLGPIQAVGDKFPIPPQVTSFPEEFRSEYVYTTTGTEAFSRVLPVGSIDADLRDDQIVIEFNPITGNVYSVFYYNGNDLNLTSQYEGGGIPREKSSRRPMLVGYYDGSGLNSSQIELEQTQAIVEFVNGQEGIVRVKIPMPESYFGDFNTFASALDVDLSIYGEYSMAQQALAGKEYVPLVIQMKQAGDNTGCTLDIDGRTIIMEYKIDSLLNRSSFANLASGTQPAPAGASNENEAALTTLADESRFKHEYLDGTIFQLLPGENITIQADVTFQGTGEDLVKIAPGIVSNVNPMFDYLQPGSSEGRYDLAISNGRNLQNLNALSPTIAKMIDSVVFIKDINWNDTVNYYNSTYGTVEGTSKIYKNASDEAPARRLPHFVPIHNAALFGTAKFDYGVQSWANAIPDGPIKDIITSIFNPNSRVPTLTDEKDQTVHAAIVGSDQENNDGIQIRNLNIDSTQNPIGAAFYAGTPDANIDRFTGLFSYVNTSIEGIHVVNPIIKGYYFETKNNKPNNPATGALLGAGGYNTYIAECSAYLDTSDPAFSETKMLGQTGYSKETAQSWYGVSGEGAVGGLVGYAKSHRTVSGELEEDEAVLAFYKCFAAVNVSGDMRKSERRRMTGTRWEYYDGYTKDYGYTNGIGGMVGNSQLTNFYNCYASGKVLASNVNVADSYESKSDFLNFLNKMAEWFGLGVEFQFSGRESIGAGGFVGTSHGTRYTNCFATGKVTATNTSQDNATLGAGAFVGAMCIDETFAYGNMSDNSVTVSTIAQRTVFTNCYSVGLVSVNDSMSETFSGATCRIAADLREFATAQVADYYRLLAPHYVLGSDLGSDAQAGKLPDYEDFYIYKDSYYLSNYEIKEAKNSNNCASPIDYDTLKNLPGYHQNIDWVNKQIVNIKKIKLVDRLFAKDPTYDSEYFQRNSSLEGEYVTAYNRGFAEGWESATAYTTHGYDLSGTYPFSKLKGLDYYGDWPSLPLNMGVAYYEDYNTSNAHHYYFDRESTSELLNNSSIYVTKDGYAILSSSKNNMSITVFGEQKSFASGTTDGIYRAGSVEYHVYRLTDNQIKAATEYVKVTGQFYVPIQVTQDNTTSTFYFNPNVAKSQVNGSDNHTFTDGNSNGKCDTCNHEVGHEYHLPASRDLLIRSARQFAGLSSMTNYLSADYRYVQQMNIDADLYQWTSANDKKLKSIGTAEHPFNTSYSGLYINDETLAQERYRLDGFLVEDAGIFGVIGNTGSISDLTISCSDDLNIGSAEMTNAAVLAGENNGAITNVELTLNGNVTLTAKANAGLLAGLSNGPITDCTVTTAENKTVTLTAPNAGGMIGNAEGTITRCGVAMNGTLQIKDAVYAGGALGHAVNTVCDQLIVSVKNLDANADIVAGLAGYAEGCTFSGSADASVTDVTVSGSLRSTGIASGVLGNAINTTLIGVDAGISEVSGSTAAGFLGVGDNVDATNCKVVITKSVTGTNGAAGVAGTIGSESVFNHVPVTLTGVTVSADGGNAAGYALEIKARAIVMGQSHVTLGGYQTSGNVLVPVNAAVIRGSQNAAGYAYTVAGSVGEAHVVGCGQIHGGNAAGFAVEVSGSISDAFVSPALTQDDAGYLGNSNANLSVTGTDSAAGFVLNVAKNGSVSTAYTLCAVSSSGTIEIEKEPEPTEETTEPSEATDPSEATTAPTEIQMESVVSAYGFAGTNSGTISRSTANVDLDSGFGFVGVNNGLITTCYGWYGDGKDDSATTARGKIAGTGNCYSTYIAQLENQAREQMSVMVYDDDGLAREVTPNRLQKLSFSGFTTGYDAHPYAPMNPENYLYPMLRDHFGSWIIPPQYSTGVAYYERYENGSVKIKMYDLSDSSLTMEQADISTQVDFDNALAIIETGYAMFYNAASGEGDGEPILTKIVGAYTYNFFPIDGTDVVEIPKPMGQAKYAYIDTRFADAVKADAVKVNAEFGDNETYQLRTPEQLTNVGQLPNAAFNQTHDIAIADGSFPAIATFGGSYNGGSLMITVGTGAEWMTETTGTVQNVNLKVNGTITEPIFGNVTGTLDTVAVTCSSTASSLIDSVSGTDTADASLTNVDLTITGEVTAFAGSGLLVNSLGSYSGITNCDVNAGSVVLNASDIPVYTVGTTDSNTFGGITGVVPTGVTLTGNTVTASLSVQGADQTLTVIGGLVGINGGTVTGGSTNVDITYTQTALNDTDDQTGIGGLVGWMLPGSSLADTSSSGAISLSEGGSGANRDWYFIGGAVGFDGGATYNGVSVTSKIDEKWAGAKLNGEIVAYVGETPEQAVAAVCPAGFGPVGKFVGYVSSGSTYYNCASVNSAVTKNYQFLGQIEEATGNTNSDSVVYNKLVDELSEISDTFDKGVNATFVDWIRDYEVYPAGTEYRIFDVVLDDCTFDLISLDGNFAVHRQVVDHANYYFYEQDAYYTDTAYQTSNSVKVQFTTPSIIDQSEFKSLAEKTYDNGVNKEALTSYYYSNNGKFYSVYIRTYKGGFLNLYNYAELYYYNDSDAKTVLQDDIERDNGNWNKTKLTVSVCKPFVELSDNGKYIIIASDNTSMVALQNGTVSTVATSMIDGVISFNERQEDADNGYIWLFHANAMRFHKNNALYLSSTSSGLVGASASKTLDLSPVIPNKRGYDNSNAAIFKLGTSNNYCIYGIDELTHVYTVIFAPNGESNHICHYEAVGNNN